MRLTVKALVVLTLVVGLAAVGAGWKWSHSPKPTSALAAPHPDGWTWD